MNAMRTRASSLIRLGWTGCSAEAVGRALWAAARLAAAGEPLTICMESAELVPAAESSTRDKFRTLARSRGIGVVEGGVTPATKKQKRR